MPTELNHRRHVPAPPSKLGAAIDGATNALICPGGIAAVFNLVQRMPGEEPVVSMMANTMGMLASVSLGGIFLARSMQRYRGPRLRGAYVAAAVATGAGLCAHLDNSPVRVRHLDRVSATEVASRAREIQAMRSLPFCRDIGLAADNGGSYSIRVPRYCAYYFGMRELR